MSKIDINQTKIYLPGNIKWFGPLGFRIVALKMLSWQATLTVKESITRF